MVDIIEEKNSDNNGKFQEEEGEISCLDDTFEKFKKLDFDVNKETVIKGVFILILDL